MYLGFGLINIIRHERSWGGGCVGCRHTPAFLNGTCQKGQTVPLLLRASVSTLKPHMPFAEQLEPQRSSGVQQDPHHIAAQPVLLWYLQPVMYLFIHIILSSPDSERAYPLWEGGWASTAWVQGVGGLVGNTGWKQWRATPPTKQAEARTNNFATTSSAAAAGALLKSTEERRRADIRRHTSGRQRN